MIPALILLGIAVAARSLLARWLDRMLLGAPVVMVLAGAAAAFALPGDALAITPDTGLAQRFAEILLAVLLFVGATAMRGGRLWGPAPGPVLRLLWVALPLGLAAATGVGLMLLPELGWPAPAGAGVRRRADRLRGRRGRGARPQPEPPRPHRPQRRERLQQISALVHGPGAPLPARAMAVRPRAKVPAA